MCLKTDHNITGKIADNTDDDDENENAHNYDHHDVLPEKKKNEPETIFR